MTDLQTLKETYQHISSDGSTSGRLAFGRALLTQNTPEFLDFHYSLLKETDIDTQLYETICRKFSERGEAGEQYLLTQIAQEPDPHIQAIALHILGTYKYKNGKHLDKTAALARNYLAATVAVLRAKALFVIGWTGIPSDIDQIAALLSHDPVPENRSWAATALMQLCFNHPEAAATCLQILRDALSPQTAWHTECAILVSMQEISGKRWGLDATDMHANTVEKLAKAKEKAMKIKI